MNPPTIEHYSFGQIRIDGQDYSRDLIITPNRILQNWRRIAGHNLAVQDLDAIFADPPNTLIIGQGSDGRMLVPNETRTALEAAGIHIIAAPTQEACRRYNAMRDHRKTAAALHLTC